MEPPSTGRAMAGPQSFLYAREPYAREPHVREPHVREGSGVAR